MFLGFLMLQEYPSGVYQTGNPPPDQNIRIIQLFLDITDSPFAVSELLTIEILLPPSGTPTNITVIYDTISYIPYIYQLSSTPPTTD